MDRSPGFGSIPSNCAPCSDSLSLRLRYTLNLATENKSLTHYTKGTQSRLLPEDKKSAPTACTYTVSGSISLPSPGFFSPFPHGTGSLSVNWEYLALEDGPPMFSQDFSCPDLLVLMYSGFRIRGCHPLWRYFPEPSPTQSHTSGLIPFRSPLLWESHLISLPMGT